PKPDGWKVRTIDASRARQGENASRNTVPGFSRPHVRIRPGEHDWADRCATVHLAPRVQSVLSCLARTGKPATLATSGCPFPKLPFSIGEEPSGGNGGFACELRAAVGANRGGASSST